MVLLGMLMSIVGAVRVLFPALAQDAYHVGGFLYRPDVFRGAARCDAGRADKRLGGGDTLVPAC